MVINCDRKLTREVNKSPEHVMINCSFHLNHLSKMTEEKLINGYKCCFQDLKKAPECNFISIPIVHDAKYNNVHFAIGFTPEEKETFGKRIQLIGSSTHPIKEGHFAVSIFTFTYMEDDDLEFIKKRATFFFKEKAQISESKKSPIKIKLYNYGDNRVYTIKIIKNHFNMKLSEAKNSIDSISIYGYVIYDLSELSVLEQQTLLKELSSNNVKYSII